MVCVVTKRCRGISSEVVDISIESVVSVGHSGVIRVQSGASGMMASGDCRL